MADSLFKFEQDFIDGVSMHAGDDVEAVFGSAVAAGLTELSKSIGDALRRFGISKDEIGFTLEDDAVFVHLPAEAAEKVLEEELGASSNPVLRQGLVRGRVNAQRAMSRQVSWK